MPKNEKEDGPPTDKWYSDNPVNEESDAGVIAKGLNIDPLSLAVMCRAAIGFCAIYNAGKNLKTDSSTVLKKHPGVFGRIEETYIEADCVFGDVRIPTDWYIGALCAIVTRSNTFLPIFLNDVLYDSSNGMMLPAGKEYWETYDTMILAEMNGENI
jgi:hypothetical protein